MSDNIIQVDSASKYWSEILKKVNKEDIIECDKCGCLLNKVEKWKRPSTIELVDAPIPFSAYHQSTTGSYCTSISESVSYASKIPKVEKMVEHYVCGRCWKEKK